MFFNYQTLKAGRFASVVFFVILFFQFVDANTLSRKKQRSGVKIELFNMLGFEYHPHAILLHSLKCDTQENATGREQYVK